MIFDREHTRNSLEAFGEKWKELTLAEIKKQDMNASGKLARSVDYEVEVFPNSMEFSTLMEHYGIFQDQGVKGVGGERLSGPDKGKKWKLKKVDGKYRKFSYKLSRGPAGKPSPRHFDKWTIRKGLAPRSSSGKFLKRQSLNYAIAEAVYRQGLETTRFFTKPFEQLFKRLPDELIEAFGLDVENFLNLALKK